jgi:hypothetical protein
MATISSPVSKSANVTPATPAAETLKGMMADLAVLGDAKTTTAAAARVAARIYQKARRKIFGFCLRNDLLPAFEMGVITLNREELDYLGRD